MPQLAAAGETVLRRHFNVTLAKTALELRGIPLFEQEAPGELPKSISCSRSFGRPVTVFEELAEAVAHYTGAAAEKYISRYFKEHFHITLSQYVNHLRLEHARQLLEESATSVTEVAMCSGYQNVSYFIRSFKKMYGVSPLKYRNFQTLP